MILCPGDLVAYRGHAPGYPMIVTEHDFDNDEVTVIAVSGVVPNIPTHLLIREEETNATTTTR